MVHGYMTTSEQARASIAYWWRKMPADLRRISKRELRLMGEFMDRVEKAREDAIEAAKLGAPTPGRKPPTRPQPESDKW